ncbi:MAG: hypothetical protein AB8B72_14595 [Crocinitomicaceae bacterium]
MSSRLMTGDKESPIHEKVIHNGYPLSVWLLTVLFGDLFTVLFFLIRDGGMVSELISASLLILIFGVVLSIPALLVFIGLFYLLKNRIKNMFVLKAILAIFTILSIILTSQIIAGKIIVGLSVIYSIAHLLSALIVNVKKEPI